MDDKKTSLDIAMLFAQDLIKYRNMGGDMSFIEVNNVYNTIENRGFFFTVISI